MKINPYLYFDGNCEEAFKFYEKCLGGKIEVMLTHEGTPAESQVPPEWRKKILHGRMVVSEYVLMASDAPPGRFHKPQGFSLSLDVKEPAEAERIYKELSANGNVYMPLQKTFFAEKFAMFTDRFGTPWMINCNPAG